MTGRKRVKMRLDQSFPEDDVDPVEDGDESAAGDSGGDAPPDASELAPGDQPSRLDQLAKSDDPVIQLVAQELRASKAREESLRKELASVKSEAAARARKRAISRKALSLSFSSILAILGRR